jgi:hypothetical protein
MRLLGFDSIRFARANSSRSNVPRGWPPHTFVARSASLHISTMDLLRAVSAQVVTAVQRADDVAYSIALVFVEAMPDEWVYASGERPAPPAPPVLTIKQRQDAIYAQYCNTPYEVLCLRIYVANRIAAKREADAAEAADEECAHAADRRDEILTSTLRRRRVRHSSQ